MIASSGTGTEVFCVAVACLLVYAACRIFGRKGQEGDMEKVSTVLNEFCLAAPGGQRLGQTRGAVKLTQYVHQQGSTLRKKEQICRRMWDSSNQMS